MSCFITLEIVFLQDWKIRRPTIISCITHDDDASLL